MAMNQLVFRIDGDLAYDVVHMCAFILDESVASELLLRKETLSGSQSNDIVVTDPGSPWCAEHSWENR